MQEINITVLTPWFLGIFLGTGILCLVGVVHPFYNWGPNASLLRFAGSGVYLVGSILVTIVFNIPRNDRLAALPPGEPDREDIWTDYLSTWTMWNHIRTAASLVSAALFALALR